MGRFYYFVTLCGKYFGYYVDVSSAIKDYSCAYFIYTIQSSYIISNYSVRTDRLIPDLGNFPLWNTDFFQT